MITKIYQKENAEVDMENLAYELADEMYDTAQAMNDIEVHYQTPTRLSRLDREVGIDYIDNEVTFESFVSTKNYDKFYNISGATSDEECAKYLSKELKNDMDALSDYKFKVGIIKDNDIDGTDYYKMFSPISFWIVKIERLGERIKITYKMEVDF